MTHDVQKRPAGDEGALLKLTTTEITAIVAALPATLDKKIKRKTIDHVTSALQAFAQEKPKENKPNIRAEILRLSNALEEALKALEEAGEETRWCLAERAIHSVAPVSIAQIETALRGFQYLTVSACDRAPPPDGRAMDVADRKLVSHLRNAFVLANPGPLSRKGWPAFLRACLAPLEGRKLVAHRSHGAWDKKLATPRLMRPFGRVESARKAARSGAEKT